ncbi:flagellar export protein FliJ [Chromobacterium haemolyticum]|uniref:flagellar export protein FliJ n=1 Tax=Chromobacterium haemolyticum TaxID=394935 RepID=UPI0009DB435D|nr:flagellar export protein FliJ [Chromobacterium haemolyticum]OQS33877.1 hypothetical protein B0T39_20360 [Chromobacterium haemolyticum]
MSVENRLKNLSCLKAIQRVRVEKLEKDLALLNQQRDAYLKNIQSLQHMFDSMRVSGASCALEMNRADYRRQVLEMVKLHQWELSVHEAKMQAGREQLWQSALVQKKWEGAYEKVEKQYCHLQKVKEQKQQDELASQIFLRQPLIC